MTLTSMLELVTDHRKLIEVRTRQLFQAFPGPKAVLRDDDGIPSLLDQLVDTLRRGDRASEEEIATVAAKYGGLLFARGFTVGELVRGYGTICEAVTKVGQELNMNFSNCEFEMLNRVFDVAIAASVTEYQRQRANATADEELQHIGALAHERRNALSAAMMAFTVIKQGVVGTSGQTSDTLDRSLRLGGDVHARSLPGKDASSRSNSESAHCDGCGVNRRWRSMFRWCRRSDSSSDDRRGRLFLKIRPWKRRSCS
jgi:hypothetical protein